MLTAEEKEELFKGILSGKITERRLPKNLYFAIAADLQKALFTGFGNTIKTKIKAALEQGPAFELLEELNRNIYVFSAAKTFQQVKDMQKFIVGADGFIRSYSQFADDVAPIYEAYNLNWQKTEFDTAVRQAKSGARELQIRSEKDIFPLAKYSAVMDDRTTPEHAAWDGIVLPVDHPWWDAHTPPNRYNCRCMKIQLEAGAEEITDADTLGGKPAHDSPLFAINVLKDAEVFKSSGPDSHPYFDVGVKYAIWKRKNFGLPLPEVKK